MQQTALHHSIFCWFFISEIVPKHFIRRLRIRLYQIWPAWSVFYGNVKWIGWSHLRRQLTCAVEWVLFRMKTSPGIEKLSHLGVDFIIKMTVTKWHKPLMKILQLPSNWWCPYRGYVPSSATNAPASPTLQTGETFESYFWGSMSASCPQIP